MIEFSRGNYEQKSRQILEATRGLSSTDLEGTHLIECLRSQLSAVTEEIKRLRNERDEARRLLKAVVDMMRDNMAPDATHPKHVCDFIYCPEIATCMVCENWTDALVMCYPDDFQDEEETK
jgi:hypothetical protein